jgi:hypothetical protein
VAKALFRLPENREEPAKDQQIQASGNAKLPFCYTYAFIAFDDLIAGRIGLLEVQGRDNPLILAQLYGYGSLELGYVQIDSKPPIDLIHATCELYGCFAKAESDASIIEQIKRAKRLLLGFRSTKGENLTVPLEPGGFSEAFVGAPNNDGSPIPDPHTNIMQKAINRMLANSDL